MIDRRFPRHTFAVAALLAAAALSGAAPAGAQSCDAIGFRIWRPDGEEVRFAQGEVIRLEAGSEAHLYVHHASRSQYPYATSAVIGHPHDVGSRASFDPQVLRLRPQDDKDRREGRLIFTVARAGRTNLGYRIEAVSQTGVFDALDARCRQGLVPVEVVDPGRERRVVERDAARAARQLGHAIEKALLPWQKATVDDQELARIVAGGRRGLVEHTVAVLRSDAFQEESYFAAIDRHPHLRDLADRYGDVGPERVAEALLDDLYGHLYGDARPQAHVHRQNVDDLLACVGGDRPPRGAGCGPLAERLLSMSAFEHRNRAALDALEAVTEP